MANGIKAQDIVDRLASHAMATGLFDRVNQHEPKTKPGRGLTCAIWVDRIEMNVRIYTNMLQNPQDAIDPKVMDAADVMFAAYSGDFGLGDDDRYIDLLGMTQGHPLFGQSGYINIDNVVMRVFTLTVPIIQEDAWAQAQ
jgi:hypothetical protein